MNMELNNNKKRAVIYCRVSTKEQVEEGNSLVTQQRNCREYAVKHGYEIAEVFIEQGESAKTADRTELQKLFSFCAIKKNNIQAVIAYKIDRISRNTDDYSQIRILLRRYGIEIKSTSEYFENTPAGRFMENIIANVAQFDNDVRTERSVGGMREAIREGRYVWQAPVGYTNQKINGKANIVKNEKAPLIKAVFELLASKNYSVESLRKELSKNGLCNTQGLPLAKSYFYRLIRNELYAGWICKLGERHKGSFEPIISEELYNTVQTVLRNKKPVRSYNIYNPDFLLRRFITHTNGEKLSGSWSKGRCKKYAYYRFPKTRIQWTKGFLEEQFFSYLNTFAFDQLSFNLFKKGLHQQLTVKSQNRNQWRTNYLEQQKILKNKQATLVQKSLNGVISDNLVKEQLDILERELWEVDEYLQKTNNVDVNFGKILQDIAQFLQSPVITFTKLPSNIQSKLLWFEFPKGITFDGSTFRTPKVCCLFKLKELFMHSEYSNVTHRGLKNKHNKSANYSILNNEHPTPLWHNIAEELVTLHQILKDELKDNLSIVHSTHRDPLKEAG